jgi:hypothetical protein
MRFMMVMIPNVDEENWHPSPEKAAEMGSHNEGPRQRPWNGPVELARAATMTQNEQERALLLERAARLA